MTSPSSLAVWNSGKKAGILGQDDSYFFNYLPNEKPQEHLVSLTMPYRARLWARLRSFEVRQPHPSISSNLRL